MRILFISSGNSKIGMCPIMQNQGESLISLGHELNYFTIQGRGLKGYLRNVFILRDYLKKNSFDIVHAHYSLSAFVAATNDFIAYLPITSSFFPKFKSTPSCHTLSTLILPITICSNLSIP